jgi:Ca-activated chloride channel family protein
VNELHFAEPGLVHLLWGVAAFTGLLFWLERRGSSALDRLVAAPLQGRLLRRPPAWRRRLRIALLGLSAASAVVALMRPQWGLRTVASQRVGAEIMIALDVSRSMLAEDVAPSRLERAKAEIADLLTYLDGDQVGLIAFAGRATVLSPLTPDFGFLRLALDSAGPGSAARGGTRLEEPIRKALAGFQVASDAQRAILLITDGEDHDSFPVDAAREAAEQGIKIIAIGFGDEAGSEIPFTDPRTGARTLLRDADGRPVRSRLDGDLLREIALATGGAYVPAGTGVLDLESIYAAHIEGLTRGRLDARGRTVRDEAYQWAVLLAIVLLVSSAALSAGSAGQLAGLALAVVLLGDGSAHAAPDVADDPQAQTPALGSEEAGTPGPSAPEPRVEPPRSVYNRGVEALPADPEEAARLFAAARAEARGDGELRRVASYNLGVAAFRRAEGLEAEDPQAALDQLHEAADWFRDAVRLGDEEDARHNLDVTLRRAMLLADRLATQGRGDLASELDALVEGQRGMATQLAALLEAEAEDAVAPEERDRRVYRRHATLQRTLLADADALAARVGAERDALEARPEAERTPEDAMRVTQLGNVQHYLHRARERMGQTRSQLRQRQGSRAYRRSSAALAELKRARDQLRDPVAVLDRLLADELQTASNTVRIAAARTGLADPGAEAPAWLSFGLLEEEQVSVADRSQELALRLDAGAAQAPPPDAPPETLALLESVAEARPFVAQATEQLRRAAEGLAASEADAALMAQRAAIAALREARERFLDLRGLIELTAAEARQIDGVLQSEDPKVKGALREYALDLGERQRRNVERAGRLAEKVDEEAQALAAVEAGGEQGPDPEQLAGARERLEAAGELALGARVALEEVAGELSQEGFGAEPAVLGRARAASGRAVETLDALRRLFFSIAEHVRELLARQVDLADDTTDAAVAAGGATEAALGSLGLRQEELSERTGQIALELEEQSNREGGVVGKEADPQESARRLRLAGEHVLAAEDEMRAATSGIRADEPALAEARADQDRAAAELEQALALLVPPGQRQQPPQDQEQPGDQGQEEQARQQEERKAAEQETDPAQLLQAVRDREAERRRERARRQAAPYETVEKDW